MAAEMTVWPATGASIVVADDDDSIRKLLQVNLEGRGYRVRIARDGQQALEMVLRDPPDLLILDIMMPVLDGLEVYRRVRQHSQVPILLLTAKHHPQDRRRGLELGATAYITKPFQLRELLASIRAAL